jgi:hypothetical protein
MKYHLLTIFLFLTTFVQGQNLRLDRDDIPAYVIKNVSDTIGIVFSIDNVQKIDKDLEVLEYFEKLNSQVDTAQYYYISLIEDLGEKVELQKYKIINLTSENFKKGEMIRKLKKDIALSDTTIVNKNKEIDNLNGIIIEKDDEIQKQRNWKIGTMIGGGVLLILVLIFG